MEGDDDTTARPHARDRRCERSFPCSVEASRRVVEDEHERSPEQGAGERDTLPEAGGERRSAGSNPCCIAVRQLHDSFMDAGLARGGDDVIIVDLAREPANSVSDRTVAQSRILRQETDMTLYRSPPPLKRHAVE